MIKVVILVFVFVNFIHSTSYIPNATIDDVAKKYGKFAKNRVVALNKLMIKLENESELKKVVEINKFFNRVKYQTDIKTWGKKDYWATRMEFLGKDMGDCEDYAIAKYFTLKQLGVDTKKLYLTYVKLVKYKQAHMVLTYFKKPKSIPLVLDNFNKKLLPATKRRDLKPVYSFNGDSLFMAKQVGLGKSVPTAFKKNKKWLKLIDDVKRNKI